MLTKYKKVDAQYKLSISFLLYEVSFICTHSNIKMTLVQVVYK